MKEIIMYKSLYGEIFKDKNACLAQDELYEKCKVIGSKLGPLPKDEGCDFSNGKGFLRHSTAIQLRLVREIEDLALSMKIVEDSKLNFLGRILSDSSEYGPLRDLYSRLQCIDSQGREWGQMYFAINENKGEQVEYKE